MSRIQKNQNSNKAHRKSDESIPFADDLTFVDILKKKHLRLTHERKILYQYLAKLESPGTIKQLVASLSSEMDQATVYRNIELFDQIGIINKIYTGWKYNIELSEKFRPHHHHMTCVNCGQVITISLGPRMEESIQNFGHKHGFKIKTHVVELRGICENCL